MAVLNVPKAYFITYCYKRKNMFALEVQRDDAFISTMLSNVKKVYFDCMLHQVCLIKQNKTIMLAENDSGADDSDANENNCD